MTGSSTQGIKTMLHPVSDLATAKAVYAALLGVPPQTDGSYYVGFEAEGQHIGLVPGGGPQGMTSPVAYWHVPDIRTDECRPLAPAPSVVATPSIGSLTTSMSGWPVGPRGALNQLPESARHASARRRSEREGSINGSIPTRTLPALQVG